LEQFNILLMWQSQRDWMLVEKK